MWHNPLYAGVFCQTRLPSYFCLTHYVKVNDAEQNAIEIGRVFEIN